MAGILTNLTNLQVDLGFKSTSKENILVKRLIEEVDEVIANELFRGRVAGSHPISSVASTEYYDGSGREQLLLNRRPVTVITRVAVDGGGYYGRPSDAFPVANDWVDGTDFAPLKLDAAESNPSILISLQRPRASNLARNGQDASMGVWPKGRGNILVTYTAGYVTIPKDLELAANLLVAQTWTAIKMKLGGPIDGVRMGDQAFRLLKSDDELGALGTVRRIIARYAA